MVDIDFDRFYGYNIDLPVTGDLFDAYSLPLEGWILGRHEPFPALHVLADGLSIRHVPFGDPAWRFPRDDVQAVFPDAAGSGTCGFGIRLGLLGLPLNFEVEVAAVFAENVYVPLAIVRGRRRPLRTVFRPRLQPLIVTSLGRTGTTWLIQLLMQHPETTTHRLFGYEAKAGGYWTHLLKVLTEPGNAYQSSPRAGFEGNPWWVGANPFNHSDYTISYPGLGSWFEREYPERLAHFCQSSIDDFYMATAQEDGVPDARFFIEKALPNHVASLMTELYPYGREVILVRDPRDMLCSILAFNQKRGFDSFGREEVASDAEFVSSLHYGLALTLKRWKARQRDAHLLRYEDLILAPERSLGAVLEYVGIDSSPKTVGEMITRASPDSDDQRAHRTSRTSQDSIGRWRRDLSPILQRLCNETFAEILEAFGYSLQ